MTGIIGGTGTLSVSLISSQEHFQLRFLVLVAEEKVRDASRRPGLPGWSAVGQAQGWRVAPGGKHHRWLTTSEGAGTSALQPRERELCQQPEWAWKLILSRSLQIRVEWSQELNTDHVWASAADPAEPTQITPDNKQVYLNYIGANEVKIFTFLVFVFKKESYV